MFLRNTDVVNDLKERALWIVMHPHLRNYTDDAFNLFPWINAQTTLMCQKIAYYCEDVKHMAVVGPDLETSSWLKHITNRFFTKAEMLDYVNNNKIRTIVYTGFHYGACIHADKDFGLEVWHQDFECFVKHDLVELTPDNTWDAADRQTEKIGVLKIL